MHTNVLFEANLTGLICSNNLEIILNECVECADYLL